MDVKQTAKGALRAIGYYRRRLQTDPYAGVAVLAYHGVRDDDRSRGSMCFENLHVTVSRLESHCECLRELGCSVVSLAEWEQIAAGTRAIPPRAVLVTFDDGYRNVLANGVPILERYEIPAVVFVCSGPVDRQVRFWFDAVASTFGDEEVERAKALDHGRWSELVARCEIASASEDVSAALTVRELQQLAAHPLIAIGAHTVSHPILARAPLAVQRAEIVESRNALEGWIGRPVTSFAYPNGRPGIDFTEDTVALLGEAGFTCAFSTREGFADPGETRYEHPRFVMLDSLSASELAHRLAISWPRHDSIAACRAV